MRGHLTRSRLTLGRHQRRSRLLRSSPHPIQILPRSRWLSALDKVRTGWGRSGAKQVDSHPTFYWGLARISVLPPEESQEISMRCDHFKLVEHGFHVTRERNWVLPESA